MLVFLLVSGLLIGFFSGMLGIGGGILIAPVLLYVPFWLGLPSLSMKAITGLTMVQGLVGSASGYLVHRKYRAINQRLIYWVSPVMVAASFLGAYLSGSLPDTFLMTIFAFMALIAALLMLIKRKKTIHQGKVPEVGFNRTLAVTLAAVVGFMGGLVGQGGSFLLVPVLINILGIPTKIALGSNLGIVLLASIAGLSGKISAGLVEPQLAFALVAGVIPGAQLGGYLSQRLNSVSLKRILAVVIILSSFHIWWTVFESAASAFIHSIPANMVFLYVISILGLILGIINAGLLIWLVGSRSRQTEKEKGHTVSN